MAQQHDLPQLMETLPQELFDNIYNLTFTARSGVRFTGGDLNRLPGEYRFREEPQWVIESPHEFPNIPWQGAGEVGLRDLLTTPDSIALFHVDRASRKIFATSFFGDVDSCFVFCNELFFIRFLQRLDRDHLKLLCNARRLKLCLGHMDQLPVRRSCELANLTVEDCMSDDYIRLLPNSESR